MLVETTGAFDMEWHVYLQCIFVKNESAVIFYRINKTRFVFFVFRRQSRDRFRIKKPPESVYSVPNILVTV